MDRDQAWTRYWRAGHTHSCFADGAPFDGSSLWRTFFDRLAEGARVLDLACGGGALTRVAAEHKSAFKVHGVDFAQAASGPQGAIIQSGVSLEMLPFEDRKFDAIISQFGLEYADLSRAIPELGRVLAPGGRVGLLMHHSESGVAQAARAGKERLAPLISQTGPVSAAIALGEAAGRAQPRPDLEARIAEALKSARNEQHDQATAWAYGFLSEIMNKRMMFPPAYLLENARTLLDELTGMSLRLQDMVAAARDSTDIADLETMLACAGCTIEQTTVVRDGTDAPLAWWTTAEAASPA